MNSTHFDTIIIGSGPAGYTAAIYASRAALKVLVLEGIERGGQLMITNEVENYPGFPQGIMGPEMMDLFRQQAERFGAQLKSQMASKITLTEKPFKIESNKITYSSDSIILAMGASARFLNIPSEANFKGKGVSACATCDGFFFKEKKVAVIGGGDTAMEEALFLTKFASEVIIIHRRDTFKASKIMFERVQKHPKISIKTFKEVTEIMGNETTGTVSSILLQDTKTPENKEHLDVKGVFIAIGHEPNTKLIENQITLDEQKYIITSANGTSTNIPGVFAAGDIQDKIYRQAVTAAGSGCMAAIEMERYLESN